MVLELCTSALIVASHQSVVRRCEHLSAVRVPLATRNALVGSLALSRTSPALATALEDC